MVCASVVCEGFTNVVIIEESFPTHSPPTPHRETTPHQSSAGGSRATPENEKAGTSPGDDTGSAGSSGATPANEKAGHSPRDDIGRGGCSPPSPLSSAPDLNSPANMVEEVGLNEMPEEDGTSISVIPEPARRSVRKRRDAPSKSVIKKCKAMSM